MTTASATPKKSLLLPMASTTETPKSLWSGRAFVTKAVMGSFSGRTSSCIFASRTMKLVAQVSSSSSSTVAPASIASTTLAACEVEPDALLVVKRVVGWPKGRLLMKAEMSVLRTERPSSARTFAAPASQTTNSRPSPGTLSYTPSSSALSRVLLPWKPPPTMTVMPFRMPMPRTSPAYGSWTLTSRDGGLLKASRCGASSASRGLSSTPLRRGSSEPLATKATRPRSGSARRSASWSSTLSRCRCRASWSSAA
mmetsp:Transcript_47583/g.151864  ORF Transcript_47583/g.151864 Transcript_47583/m.151864 type:complete len:254 (-) Transcript_47583:195-956(-)